MADSELPTQSETVNTQSELTIQRVFGLTALAWGKKYPSSSLQEVWEKDPEYLLWACNLLGPGRKGCDSPPPPLQRNLIAIAHLLSTGRQAEAEGAYAELSRWQALSQDGIGLSDLARPTPEECRKTLEQATLLGGHGDLDGIYSLAIAINRGKALAAGRGQPGFGRLRIFRYGFQNLHEYSANLRASSSDVTVIIDFSAHPSAALNLDHHTTSLSYWEIGTTPPRGIFEPSMPSCPRLLGTLCGLDVPEPIMSGTDLIDGALYQNVVQASDLSNPFVALELCLSVDTGDSVAKKVVLTLAQNDLDPHAVLDQEIWKARLRLVALELDEQRSYWQKDRHLHLDHEFVAVADARLAPYSASRFRYLPLERDDVREKPYIITIRPSSKIAKVNLGLGQNPFYRDLGFFRRNPVNFGALARSLGQGGGRNETASVTFNVEELAQAVATIKSCIQETVL